MEFYVTLQALRILRWLLNIRKTHVLLFICNCFQGSLNRERENSSGIHSKYQPSDHIIYQEAWPLIYRFFYGGTQTIQRLTMSPVWGVGCFLGITQWHLQEDCLKHCLGIGLRLLGMTFHKNPFERVWRSAVYHAVWIEQMPYGRSWNKNFPLVMKVLALTD